MITADEEYSNDILPEDHWSALDAGCEILIDEGLADLKLLKDGLPRCYDCMYDDGLLRRFLVCLLMVHYKLRSQRWQRLACIGEELALWAAILQAKSVLEVDETEVHEKAFETFTELAFKDLDFETLYTQEIHSIESDPQLIRQAGLMHLHPKEWFLPFDKDEPVYPFAE